MVHQKRFTLHTYEKERLKQCTGIYSDNACAEASEIKWHCMYREQHLKKKLPEQSWN